MKKNGKHCEQVHLSTWYWDKSIDRMANTVNKFICLPGIGIKVLIEWQTL